MTQLKDIGFQQEVTTQTELTTALDGKVDKVVGKQLSQEDYTTVEKSKLAGIEAGAEVNNISDVNATDLTDGGDTTLHTHDSRYYTESETDTLLNAKANDNAVVKLTGNQTIGGDKSFTGVISASNLSGFNTGDETYGTITGKLGYIPANDLQVVKLTGNQSILGRKHFYNNDTFLGDGAKSYVNIGNLGTDQEVYLDARSDVYTDVDMYIRAKGIEGDINFVTNSVNRLFIKSDGNVGIGTTSPTSSLVVAGVIQSIPTINGVHMGTNGDYTGIELAGTPGGGGYIDFTQPGTDRKGRIIYFNSPNFMAFYTNSGEKIRIIDSGNVGINESSPDYKLDVNGAIGFTPGIGTTITPVDNGDIVFEATSNTSLTVKMKGSDGVIRSTTLTLA